VGADIAGVRSAACRDGRRDGDLDPARVRELRARCGARAATPPPPSPPVRSAS
jgi:hypothetical protein